MRLVSCLPPQTRKNIHEDTLAEAVRLRYAEADPTLDVSRFDARRKLKILLRLTCGTYMTEGKI